MGSSDVYGFGIFMNSEPGIGITFGVGLSRTGEFFGYIDIQFLTRLGTELSPQIP